MVLVPDVLDQYALTSLEPMPALFKNNVSLLFYTLKTKFMNNVFTSTILETKCPRYKRELKSNL
jgi:hypothetical protein